MYQSSPLVSIIMAVKDTEPYLPDCLDSILNQTYQNWELIAVNDHSTDNSLSILEIYQKRDIRIRVFSSDRQKLIPTLKHGYQFAKGDLINRMDSDDKMPEDKLEILVNKWLTYRKGHVIAGGTQHFVDEGEVGGGFIRYENWLNDVARSSTHYEQIYQECVIPSHCWIIHRDDFEAVGGFEPEVYPEDYDLCFRYYQHRLKVIGVDKVLHYWRDRSDRISRTWEEYQDNRYFDLKVKYFYEIDRDKNRPLVLWGAGKHGKDLAKLLLKHEDELFWVCDNPKKIGLSIYDTEMHHFDAVSQLEKPQILVAVASPEAREEIQEILDSWNKTMSVDCWFFC